MIKSFIVDMTCNNMRIDRLLRNKLGKIPESLIETNLRSGKIKLNKKKVKSSLKVKVNDKIELFNFNYKETIIQKKIKYDPSKKIIKAQVFLSKVEQSQKKIWSIFLQKVKFLVEQNPILFTDLIKIHQEFL